MNMNNLLLIGLVFFVWSLVLLVTYQTVNEIYCDALEDGKFTLNLKIQRNGDGTISLMRKEFLGIWFKTDLHIDQYRKVYSIIESQDAISQMRSWIKCELELAKSAREEREQEKEELKLASLKQKSLPKIIE